MPLHIDYRPKDFKDFFGNSKIIKSMQTMVSRKDSPRAWLFVGPSGCGKTTFARIISKHLGCDPVSTNQDFCEINASNNRGIDTARDIQRGMAYRPMNSENSCRVYLLEECHQITKDAQNALLRALEDTPKHVYFLLCTTDPEKLLPTIRNRCTTFEVKKLTDPQMGKLLNNVLESEGVIDVDEETKKSIVETSDGCPRQALVLLDQVIDLPPDEMLDAVRTSQATKKQIIDLCRALMKDDWGNVRVILKDLKEEPEKIRQAVNYYMQNALLNSPELNERALLVLTCFCENTFHYNGKPGLVKACADIFV